MRYDSSKIINATEQIKNKFKYLKQKYLEKKDNLGYKSSGASTMKFDYCTKWMKYLIRILMCN